MTGQLYSDASSEHHATNIRVQTMQTNKPSSSPFTPLLPNYAIGSDKWMMCRMKELNMGFVDMLRTPPALSTHKADAPVTPLLKPAGAKPPADPRMPKRACSSFILFSNAERANVKCEHPSATPVEILKSLGEKWRAADADTKAKYAALYLEHKAKADHVRRVYATGEVASPIPSDRASQKCETPDQTTSLPDDDDSAGQWCDGYSRAVPNTPGSTDYPHILWKLRI